jgi:hypothetical protein
VLLPNTDPPDLPPLLDGMTWVNLGVDIPDPYDQLVWGITGRRPGVDASEPPDGSKTTA